ncbi:hypothetical protein ACFQ5D_04080 [Paenibacillus farraposensis]|uniref:Uncharacterized protein n=1 Tax=Paenibacillus farraposensis TaxID=2807095 RepID=A0ABW4D7F2_9BACL|nr:hypothetical protein [Paenibacillus farraposensis]MCC3382213.1 hypothetical protein [Paenibacillus farraposensis]
MELFFRDNFFSTGLTEIMDGNGEVAGSVDLKSAFNSSVDVYDAGGRLAYGGKFRFFVGKWEVRDATGQLAGVLRVRMSLMSKRYEYDAGPRGVYEITSPAFSKEYAIQGHDGKTVAVFNQTNRWFQSGTFHLENGSLLLDSYELIVVVMGIHAIQNRNSSAGSQFSV